MAATGRSTRTDIVDAALDYAARGWHVFPVRARGKQPLTKHGVHDATVDPDTIRAWWARWPDANVAVATGRISGIVVVDLDGPTGEASFDRLVEQHGPAGETLAALTGNGMHLVFAAPAGLELRNTAGKLGPGIDTRADGGYIVAPPSVHPSDVRYEWLDGAAAVLAMPDWLVATLAAAGGAASVPPPSSSLPPAPALAGSAGTGAPRRPSAPAALTQPAVTRYAQVTLDARVNEVAAAVPGQRNHTLNQAAFRLGQLIAGGQIDEQTVVDALTAAAASCGLHGTEVAATIRSGLTSGAQRPQYLDPARTASPPDPPRAAQPEDARPTPTRPVGTAAASPPPPADDDVPPAPPERDVVDDDDDPDGEINETDLGNARRLIRNYGRELRFARHRNLWLRWDGRRWAIDDDGHVERCAHATAQAIMTEAVALADPDERKRRVAWSLKSEMQRQLEAMVRRAAHLRGVSVTADELDADPWKLNVLNGTLDLRSGRLHPHDPADLITKLAPVVYDPDAHDARWDAYLHSALAGDQELADWIQRAVGYTLTGDTSEEVLFFVHGPTRAGKSTFLEAIKTALGDYARNADFETFLDNGTSGGVRSDIARLAGARLVTGNEIDEGRKLAEGLIKTLTGGDTITARFLYRDEFEYRPQFKLWLAANHKPRVKHSDDAIWRRIRLVPFVHPPATPDPSLKTHLIRDPGARAAILTWALAGCTAWRTHGLRAAAAVANATETYRAEMDPLAEFFTDHCAFGPHDTHWVTAADLRKTYETWATEQGLRRTISPKAFSELLEERNCRNERRRIDGKTTRIWAGIRLVSEWELAEQLPGIGVAPVATAPDDAEVSENSVTSVATPDNARRARRLDATSEESPYARAQEENSPEHASNRRARRAADETGATHLSGTSPDAVPGEAELLAAELGAIEVETVPCRWCGAPVPRPPRGHLPECPTCEPF